MRTDLTAGAKREHALGRKTKTHAVPGVIFHLNELLENWFINSNLYFPSSPMVLPKAQLLYCLLLLKT